MKRIISTFLVSVYLIIGSAFAEEDISQITEAERVALQATIYQNNGEINKAVALFHPEALEGIKRMAIHIFNTPNSSGGSDRFLGMFGVQNVEELKEVPLETFGLVMLQMNERQKTPQMKALMSSVKFEVIGSVPDGNQVHVVLRSTTDYGGNDIHAVSAVTVKKHEDQWLFLGTGKLP